MCLLLQYESKNDLVKIIFLIKMNDNITVSHRRVLFVFVKYKKVSL